MQRENIRRVLYPTAVPRAMGNRTDTAGLLKMVSGRVSRGMYVVMMVALGC